MYDLDADGDDDDIDLDPRVQYYRPVYKRYY